MRRRRGGGGAARWALVAACAAIGAAAPGGTARGAPEPAPLRFDRYHDGAALEAALRAIARAHPAWTRLEEMGRSREGRPLWVMTVFDPAGPDPATRPAMYVDGNTHGNELQGTEICLFLVSYLLERAPSDPWVGALLRRATFHVAPCVNPDARERFLHAPTTEHSPRGVLRPVDDDRDGKADEDPPNDLDGDGEILQMRVRDAAGPLVAEEADDRLMRPRKAGETRAGYRVLGSEGVDDDGDGERNEDGWGAVDPNRNWPTEWRSEGAQHGAGPYPLSEPETRATALFVLSHPRIAAVQSFHNAGEMILRPPASRTDRDVRFPDEDRAVYDELARRGGRVLPGYRYLQIREGLYNVHGGFVDWTFSGLGIFSFTNEVWGNVGAGEGREGELDRLRWNDDVLHGAGFQRWKEVAHPELGTVEVGGWRRYTLRNTPADFLPDLCLRNARFVLEHAAAMPDLAVTVAERAEEGRRVRVVVENRALLPTVSAWARRHRLVPPDELEAVGSRVLAAADVVPGRAPVALPVREGRARLEAGVPGSSRVTVDLWLSSPSSSVRILSRHGGIR